MTFSTEYKQQITQKAWQTYHVPETLLNEYASREFYRIANEYAEKEFWLGKWCDIPADEEGQIYWLQQYWMFISDRVITVIEKER